MEINKVANMIDSSLPIILIFLILALACAAITYVVHKINLIKKYQDEKRYYFEVIPPASAAIQAQAAAQVPT